MSRKLTLDINFIQQPRDNDTFGYQITNNGVNLSFSGATGWDKTFKSGGTTSISARGLMSFDNDLTQNSSDNTAIANGFDAGVFVVKKQSDGKYICVGAFTAYQNYVLPSRYICRLNTDFTLDTTFTPPSFNYYIPTLEIDSSDRIYIGGYDIIDGKGYLVRLTANGPRDTTYMAGIGFNRPVTAIKLQPDGKLIVGGVFTTFNSSAAPRIIRLTTTGAKDTTFNGVNQGFSDLDDQPRTIELQSTGRIVIGGDFAYYNNNGVENIVMLNANGSFYISPTGVDLSRNGALKNVMKVVVDSVDRIYVTGNFTQVGGSLPINSLYRLSSLGIYDSTFNVGTGLNNCGNDLAINAAGDIVVAGDFTTYNGTSVPRICVLNGIGGLSPASEITSGIFNSGLSSILLVGSKYLVGGSFTSYSNPTLTEANSTQYTIPIAEDVVINFGSGFNGNIYKSFIYGGELICFGDFTTYKGSNTCNSVAKISLAGDFISGFTGTTDVIKENVVLLNDGSFLIAGIDSANAIDCTTTLGYIIKFNNDLTQDTSFNTGEDGFSTNPITSIFVDYPITKKDDDSEIIISIGSLTDSDNYNGNDFLTNPYGGKYIKIDPTGVFISQGQQNRGYKYIDYSNNENHLYFSNIFYGGPVPRGFRITNLSGATEFNLNGVNKGLELDNGNLILKSFSPSKYNDEYGVDSYSFGIINSDGSSLIQANAGTGLNDDALPNSNMFTDGTGIYVYNNATGTTYNGVSVNKLFKLDQTLTIDNTFNSTTDMLIYDVIFKPNYIVLYGDEINIIDYSGNSLSIIDNLPQTIENTYDNLVAFNSGTGISYTKYSDKVEMIYTFDDDEIVINNVFDTPDYVEITYINESLTINDIIQEVVVRSPLLIKSDAGSYDSVNYQVRIFDGSLFSATTFPVSYEITKQKLFSGQDNVYININNYVKEDLEADVSSILNNNYYIGTSIPMNMSKWVRVDETLLLTGSTVDTNISYMLATDGYLYNYEDQFIPSVLLSGLKRYCRYNQRQNIYYQTNFLINVIYTDSDGTDVKLSSDKNLEILNNQYINSIAVNTAVDWVQYTFNYSNSSPVTVRYEMYTDCQHEPYSLVFKNKWGMLESIPMSRKSVISLNVEAKDFNRSILNYNGEYDINRHTNKQYNLDGYNSWTLNSNWLPEYMNESLEELMLSEEVWLIDGDDKIIPVIKENQNIDYKTNLNDKLIQYSMKVKMSHSKIKNIL